MKTPNPLLAQFFRLVAGLVILGSVIMGALAFREGTAEMGIAWIVGGLFTGVFYLGIAEVIVLIARIAASSEETTALLRAQVAPTLSVAPRTAAQPAKASNGLLYYYIAKSGDVLGPESLDTILTLRDRKKVTDETLVVAQGADDWQPFPAWRKAVLGR